MGSVFTLRKQQRAEVWTSASVSLSPVAPSPLEFWNTGAQAPGRVPGEKTCRS